MLVMIMGCVGLALNVIMITFLHGKFLSQDPLCDSTELSSLEHDHTHGHGHSHNNDHGQTHGQTHSHTNDCAHESPNTHEPGRSLEDGTSDLPETVPMEEVSFQYRKIDNCPISA
jgi:hypothetical protein